MGYRHYLGIVKKADLLKINEEYIKNLEKQNDECLIICDLLESIGAKEVYELGKYSDEGYALVAKQIKLDESLLNVYQVISEYADNNEYGFNILTQNELEDVIKSYHDRTIKYLRDLLKEKDYENEFDERTREQRLVEYVQSKITWREYSYDLKGKYKVQGTWQYEYAIYDLVHIYKTVNWNDYVLLVWGW